jgi:hypothetical protein
MQRQQGFQMMQYSVQKNQQFSLDLEGFAANLLGNLFDDVVCRGRDTSGFPLGVIGEVTRPGPGRWRMEIFGR